MACEQNILEVPVTPSLAAATDLVMITLPDGTTFLRPWAQFLQTVPSDIEHEVAESGGELNNGDASKIISEHIGWRVRLVRNAVKQGRIPNVQGQYYDFDINTGEYMFVPAVSTGEILQFEAY